MGRTAGAVAAGGAGAAGGKAATGAAQNAQAPQSWTTVGAPGAVGRPGLAPCSALQRSPPGAARAIAADARAGEAAAATNNKSASSQRAVAVIERGVGNTDGSYREARAAPGGAGKAARKWINCRPQPTANVGKMAP